MEREAHDYGTVPAWCAGVDVAVCGAEGGVAGLEVCQIDVGMRDTAWRAYICCDLLETDFGNWLWGVSLGVCLSACFSG